MARVTTKSTATIPITAVSMVSEWAVSEPQGPIRNSQGLYAGRPSLLPLV